MPNFCKEILHIKSVKKLYTLTPLTPQPYNSAMPPFQKGKSNTKRKDFSVALLTTTQALEILQTIKAQSDETIEETWNGFKPIRSSPAGSFTFTTKQKKLILGIYTAIISGFDQLNLGMVCRGLGFTRATWYAMIHEGNRERTKALMDWVEQIVIDVDKTKLAAIKASMADEAAKGNVKAQELWMKVNGYLKPDATPGGVAVNFQLFKQFPQGKQPETNLIIEQNDNEPLNQGHTALPPQVGGTMAPEEVENLLPFLTEAEPLPDEKKLERNPHGERYNKQNHFLGEELV